MFIFYRAANSVCYESIHSYPLTDRTQKKDIIIVYDTVLTYKIVKTTNQFLECVHI